MSKAKFAAAKELIDEKKYDEARGILKSIDHPTAREWEAKLDKIAPQVSYKPSEPNWMQSPPPPLKLKPAAKTSPIGCRNVLVLTVVILIIIVLTQPGSSPPSPAPTQDATMATLAHITATAQQIAFNATATIIALTPSATITETPLPSETPTSAPTNSPPTDVLGTKSNPYPLQGIGSVRDGRFRVNHLTRNQTAAVKTTNQFNDDPPVGGEYVLANVTFYCDLESDKTCTVSLMDLEIVGKAGKVYNKPFSTVLDTPFKGDVFGGGETSGDVAFIVNSTDSNFEVIVNDLGSRIFFATGT